MFLFNLLRSTPIGSKNVAAPKPGAKSVLAWRDKIVKQALLTKQVSDGKKYTKGGKTTAGFDCSGFVWYVLNQAFPDDKITYQTAESFADSDLCDPIAASDRKPGDFIFFRNHVGEGDHIGIIVSDLEWIGSQSSTGVAKVSFSNSYWSKKTIEYFRYSGASALSARYQQHKSRQNG